MREKEAEAKAKKIEDLYGKDFSINSKKESRQIKEKMGWEERFDEWFYGNFGEDYMGTYPQGDLHNFIKKELSREYKRGLLDGVFGKDKRTKKERIQDLKQLHSADVITEKELEEAIVKLKEKKNEQT